MAETKSRKISKSYNPNATLNATKIEDKDNPGVEKITAISGSTNTLKDELALMQLNRVVDNGFTIKNMVAGVSDDFNDENGLVTATDSNAYLTSDYLTAGSFEATVSQSDFESYFTNGTYSTFTFSDATYGNYLTLASPGGNNFREHNTIKSGGFTAGTFIEWEISGYGFCGFGTTTTNASAEASEAWYNGQSGSNVTTPKNSSGTDTYFYTYFASGANATSGNIVIIPYNNGSSGSSYTISGKAQYYGGTYPIKFQMGVDTSNRIYIKVLGDGQTNQTDVTGPLYINTSNNTLTDDPVSNTVLTETSNFQFVWGNYDGGSVESMRRLKVKYPNNQTGSAVRTSTITTASSAPSSARVMLIGELGTGTLNTDSLKYELSRDSGDTFTAATLVSQGAYAGHATKKIYTADIDLSSQPSGTSLISRFTVDPDDSSVSKIHAYTMQYS